MFENLRRDSARYAVLGGWFTHPGFWIVAVYRFGMWAHGLPSPLLRLPMWVLYRIARIPFVFFNVHLWAGRRGAKIGPGFCLIHPTNVSIGRLVEIGEGCLIFNDVTLGTGTIGNTPKLGDRVDVYVGARILGGVTIGHDSMVGANCVVTRDVPNASVVLSAPSRVIPRALSPVARGVDGGAVGESTGTAAERAGC
jgi:serine O-acetyltransferase